MATKKISDPSAIRGGREVAEANARKLLQPEVRSVIAIKEFSQCGDDLDLVALHKELSRQVDQMRSGNLGKVEAMLYAQAQTLDAMFFNLATRAHRQMGQGDYLYAADTYMKLALRAQSQCRATLEALATIKNPPVVYAKQANVTTGPQQVNNTVNNCALPVANAEKLLNELSGGQHGVRENRRAAQAPVGGHPPLEAVGKKLRAENHRG